MSNKSGKQKYVREKDDCRKQEIVRFNQ